MVRTRMNAVFRRLGRREDGQALVEFALIVPIFLLLVFAVVEFGQAWNVYQSINSSAGIGGEEDSTQWRSRVSPLMSTFVAGVQMLPVGRWVFPSLPRNCTSTLSGKFSIKFSHALIGCGERIGLPS